MSKSANILNRILKGVSDDETDATTLETVGFIRGVAEACLVCRYMKNFDFTPELFNMNEISDRETLGVLLNRLFVLNEAVFTNSKTLNNYFKESSNALMRNVGSKTMAGHRKETVLFINNLISGIDSKGFIAGKNG